MVLAEMLMFGEVWAAVELDPGRILFPAVAYHQVSYAGEITLSRQLVFVRQCWIARRDFLIVPQKLKHRQHPLFGEEPAVA